MSSRVPQLSVNVDHVATLRQARRAAYPDPVEAAKLALEAGAQGTTVHLREDRRHIQEDDVRRLRQVTPKLNLEIAGTEAMVRIAQEVRPHQVTLVPERPDEVTTEGGLDLLHQYHRIQRVATSLHDSGIAVSIFLDPELDQIKRAAELDNVEGFEINTDAYTRASDHERRQELSQIAEASSLGDSLGLRVYAGHGLTVSNVTPIAALPEVRELNIGHSIVCRAVLIGMVNAVEEMLAAISPR